MNNTHGNNNIHEYRSPLFAVKLICCIAFGSASSAHCLLESPTVNL